MSSFIDQIGKDEKGVRLTVGRGVGRVSKTLLMRYELAQMFFCGGNLVISINT